MAVMIFFEKLAIRVRGGLCLWDLASPTTEWFSAIDEPLFGVRPLQMLDNSLITVVSGQPAGNISILSFDGFSGDLQWTTTLQIVPADQPIAVHSGVIYVYGSQAGQGWLISLDPATGFIISEETCMAGDIIISTSNYILLSSGSCGIMVKGIGILPCPGNIVTFGSVLTDGNNLYMALSEDTDAINWTLLHYCLESLDLQGDVNLGALAGNPMLFPGISKSRIGVLNRHSFRSVNIASKTIDWLVVSYPKDAELFGASWTPYGWVLGYWEQHPIQFFHNDTGSDLGSLGINKCYSSVSLWWLQSRLVISHFKGLISYTPAS